jgi:hypothetical protein
VNSNIFFDTENDLQQVLIFAVELVIIIKGMFHFWHVPLDESSTNTAQKNRSHRNGL